MTNFLRHWWPTLLTLAVVLYATLASDPAGAETVMLFEGADKLIHAIMMGGLDSAVLFDRRRSGHRLTRNFKWGVAIACIVFSAFDEIAQQTMGLGRSLDIYDFVADVIGIIIASYAAPPVINHIFRNRP